jgi:DNA polymerase-3 subunit beta
MSRKQEAATATTFPLDENPTPQEQKKPTKKNTEKIEFTIDRETLLKELQLLCPVAGDENTSAPITRNILIEANQEQNVLFLLATNLETALQTKVPANIKSAGKITIAAKDLLRVIKSASGSTINFNFSKETLLIRFDSTEFQLPTISPTEYPSIPNINDSSAIDLPSSLLRTAIKPVIFAITDDELRYALSSARLEIDGNMLQLVATDGHRLSYIAPRAEQTISPKGIETLIPKLALEQLDKLLGTSEQENVRFCTENNFAMFQVDQRTLIYRGIESQFPQFEKFILLKGERKVTFETSRLKEALQKITVLSDNRSRTAVFEVKADKTTISWQKDTSRAKTELPSSLEGEDIQVAFNPTYFLDFLKITDASEVILEITGENTASIMKPAGENNAQQLYIVMPMRA